MVDSRQCCSHGILFSPQHQVLLVADGTNCRVLVLHPRDGSHLQTIQLGNALDDDGLADLCLHQNKLVCEAQCW